MKVFSFRNIGKRKYQEDEMYVDPAGKLFIVCDGVGGSKNGDVASKLVIETIVRHYNNEPSDISTDTINYYIQEALLRISRVAEVDDTFDGMATTLSLVYLCEGSAITAHVGDSRVYHIKSKEDWTVTRDHSMVRELFDAGVLKSEQEMSRHPFRNRITKAIKASNSTQEVEPEITTIDGISEGDLFLLCSDGAVENYLNEELVDHFTNETMTLKSQWDIFKEECKLNSKDNNTCILIRA